VWEHEAMATGTGHPDAGVDAGITWRLQIIPQNRVTHVLGDGAVTVSPYRFCTEAARAPYDFYRKLVETAR